MTNQEQAAKLRIIAEIIDRELQPNQWEVNRAGSPHWLEPQLKPMYYADLVYWTVRIKPTPKRVPLSAEDVPPGSVIRHRERATGWTSPSVVDEVGVYAGQSKTPQSWSELMENFRILRPGQTWQPCWKEQAE